MSCCLLQKDLRLLYNSTDVQLDLLLAFTKKGVYKLKWVYKFPSIAIHIIHLKQEDLITMC